jgi:molecular chaperone Hsp33
MPGATDADTATWARAVAAVDATAEPFAAGDAHSLLGSLFQDDDVRAFRPRTPHAGCSCSRERVAGALKLIGLDEVESILVEQGAIGVNCEFCNRRYEFGPAEARALFAPRAAAIN